MTSRNNCIPTCHEYLAKVTRRSFSPKREVERLARETRGRGGVCVCVTSPRWQHGVHKVTGCQQFRDNFVWKWHFCSQWVELYTCRAHFGASDAAPCRQQALLLSWFCICFHRSPATFTLCWTPPINTPLSPHPLGSLELAVGPYRYHDHQWLRHIVRST